MVFPFANVCLRLKTVFWWCQTWCHLHLALLQCWLNFLMFQPPKVSGWFMSKIMKLCLNSLKLCLESRILWTLFLETEYILSLVCIKLWFIRIFLSSTNFVGPVLIFERNVFISPIYSAWIPTRMRVKRVWHHQAQRERERERERGSLVPLRER